MICQVIVKNVRCLHDGRIYIAACVHEHVAKVSVCDLCIGIFTRPICTICRDGADGHDCAATLTLRPGEA